MSRNLILSIILLITSITYFYQKETSSFLVTITHMVKKSFYDTYDYFEEIITLHTNQVETIKSLREDNIKLQKIATQNIFLQFELNNLLVANNLKPIHTNTSVYRFSSYNNLKNSNKFYVEFSDYSSEKTYGLIQDNIAIGIIINHKNKPTALLNADKNCNYSVYIGDENSLGITSGYNNDYKLLVDFIPNKSKINIGDLVRTSGLDQLFMPGFEVGKVIKIEQNIGYKSVLVEPSIVPDTSKLFYTLYNIGSGNNATTK